MTDILCLHPISLLCGAEGRLSRRSTTKKCLDRLIARGDDIVLSNPVKNIDEVSGAFRMELDYLIRQGFRLSEDGARLIK